jgi:hypothetical protein
MGSDAPVNGGGMNSIYPSDNRGNVEIYSLCRRASPTWPGALRFAGAGWARVQSTPIESKLIPGSTGVT